MFLSDVSIRRPVFTGMLITALLVFGAVSYSRIGLDMMPDVDFPLTTVVTVYPGADPETVEREISERIEDAVSTLNGVRTLRSVSVENVSQVIIEFELERDIDQATQDVRDKIAGIEADLPEDADPPQVQKLDLDAMPILTVAVGGPGAIDRITEFAEKRVQEPLQSLQGVGTVEIVGGQEREIKVWIDPDQLEVRGLSVTDVIQALAASNLDFPGGRLTTGTTEFTVTVDGEFGSVAEIADLKIREVRGQPVRLRDVARVEDGLEERRSAAALDGAQAVVLSVRKQSGTNAVRVGDRVKARLAELAEQFPPGYEAFVAVDNTTFTRTSIEHVQFDMLFGAFLAVVIVFLFLRNVRSTLIAALAIPTSVVGTFAFILAMGFTFNTLTMLALTLSIGILIDDAIVVIENIYRHLEQGKTAMVAAGEGAGEIGLAVLATTMSIVAVFVPVAFTQGMVGQMFYEFGLTVAVAVLISLFVSFTLTPMLSSRTLVPAADNWFYRGIERVLGGLDRGYRAIIGWALRHRISTVGIALAVFAGSLYLAGLLPTSFIPSFDMSRFNVVVTTPTGTNLAETERVAGRVAARIRAHEDLVAGTVTTIGADAQQKQNVAKVFVKMTPKEQRAVGQMDFMDRLRRQFAELRAAEVSVEEIGLVGGDSGMRNAAIQFDVRGGDLEQLDIYTRQIVAALEQRPGFVDLDTTWEAGKPEVEVVMDRERAAGLGVVTASVGQAVRALIGGVEASQLRLGGEDIPIRVRLPGDERRRAEQIADLEVRSAATGRLIPLPNLAEVRTGTGPTQIDRQARQRQITVLGNLTADQALGPALDEVRRVAAEILPPEIQTGFSGEARVAEESMGHLLFSLALAVIMIYMVLASQFESLIHPLTIMMSLPLSVVGALGALLLAGQHISIMAMIGIIMLMGLVTKNAILLIDYTNTLRRRDGLERTEALLTAGPVRLRPILMTTAAMVFGMLPIAVSRGYGAEMRAPMAVAVIGGLIMSTLLTLVVVPVVYSLFDDAAGLLGRLRRRGAGRKGAAAPARSP
jgi:HAE1 family hydrophobic/amphiphilic exporter-1